MNPQRGQGRAGPTRWEVSGKEAAKKSHLPTAGRSRPRGAFAANVNVARGRALEAALLELKLHLWATAQTQITCGANGGKIRDTAAEKIAASECEPQFKMRFGFKYVLAARELLGDLLGDFGHGRALGCE